MFIGPLSRFSKHENEFTCKVYDIMGILSATEPQRTIFEELIIDQLRSADYNAVIIRGIPNNEIIQVSKGKITIYSHLKEP